MTLKWKLIKIFEFSKFKLCHMPSFKAVRVKVPKSSCTGVGRGVVRGTNKEGQGLVRLSGNRVAVVNVDEVFDVLRAFVYIEFMKDSLANSATRVCDRKILHTESF